MILGKSAWRHIIPVKHIAIAYCVKLIQHIKLFSDSQVLLISRYLIEYEYHNKKTKTRFHPLELLITNSNAAR